MFRQWGAMLREFYSVAFVMNCILLSVCLFVNIVVLRICVA